jgi:hypothetical protein
LDDEIWEIRFNFPGEDNLERTLSRSDITVLNLYALVEEHGFSIRDGMYYVKEKGKGLAGMEIVDIMVKVEEMLALYEHELVLELTVMKRQSATRACLNQVAIEAQKMINEPVLMSVDPIGVTHICDDEEAVYSMPLDFYDVLYLGTQ